MLGSRTSHKALTQAPFRAAGSCRTDRPGRTDIHKWPPHCSFSVSGVAVGGAPEQRQVRHPLARMTVHMLGESRELRIPWRDERGSSKRVRCDSLDQVSIDRAGSACRLESARPGLIHVQPEDRTILSQTSSRRVALMRTNSTACTYNPPEDWRSASGQRAEDLAGQVRVGQRPLATFRCSRSPVDLSRSSVGTRERLHPPASLGSTPSAKVKFQGGPVVR